MPACQINCPHCNSLLNVQSEWANMQVKCPACEKMLTVPPQTVQPFAPQYAVPFYSTQLGFTPDDTQEASMFTALKKYAQFSGRASRREYWLFDIFEVILSIVLFGISLVAPLVQALLSFILGIALFLPRWGVAVRRCHDIGHSGWWICMNLIPLVGPIIYFVSVCFPSQPGTNKYGLNPNGDRADAAWPMAVGVIMRIFWGLISAAFSLFIIFNPTSSLASRLDTSWSRLPSWIKLNPNAEKMHCMNNLKVLGTSLIIYGLDNNNEVFPEFESCNFIEPLVEFCSIGDLDEYPCPYIYVGQNLSMDDNPDLPLVICYNNHENLVQVVHLDGHAQAYSTNGKTFASPLEVVDFLLNKLDLTDDSQAQTVRENAAKAAF